MSSLPLVPMLSAEELAALERLGHPCRARRGHAIISEGQVADSVLLVTTGTVKITSVTSGGEEVVLGFRGPGELLGEQAVLDGSPRSATVVAVEPLEYLSAPASDFRSYLVAYPRVSQLLISMLSRRLREAGRAQVEYAAADTVGRVSARLLELAEHYGEAADGGVRVSLPLTQQELAGWAGASLEATARALRQLRELGWIETARREMVIRDPAALRRRAP
jgi:CRP-like cAMP-binding protein